MNDDFHLSIKNQCRKIRDVRDLFQEMTPSQAETLDYERKRAEYEKNLKNAILEQKLNNQTTIGVVSRNNSIFIQQFSTGDLTKKTAHFLPIVEQTSAQSSQNKIRKNIRQTESSMQVSASEPNLFDQPGNNSANESSYKNSKSEAKLGDKSVNFRNRIRSFFFNHNQNIDSSNESTIGNISGLKDNHFNNANRAQQQNNNKSSNNSRPTTDFEASNLFGTRSLRSLLKQRVSHPSSSDANGRTSEWSSHARHKKQTISINKFMKFFNKRKFPSKE